MSNSLYNPMTILGKEPKALEHPYKGKVVQVENDPNFIGRIKVSVPELFGDYQEGAESAYPWIYPRYYGKFSNLLEFECPEKGDIVEIEFPYRNIYIGYYTNKPLYKGVWDKLAEINPDLGATIKQVFCGVNYPNVYGSFNRNLTGWYIDKVTDEIFLVQGTTKCSIKFDSSGSVVVTSPTNLIFNAQGSIVMNATSSIEMSTETLAQGCTSYQLDSTTMTTKGTQTHTGTITSDGDQIAGGISQINHTHKYTTPQHAAGQGDTNPPTK